MEDKKVQIVSLQARDTWPIRHVVMWPDKPLSYVVLERDEIGKHFGLQVGQKLVSVISLFVDGEVAQFRKLATLKEAQGRGYGSQLLLFVINYAKANGVKKLWCNARKDKTSFYEKFGFRPTASTFKKGGLDYVIMESSILTSK